MTTLYLRCLSRTGYPKIIRRSWASLTSPLNSSQIQTSPSETLNSRKNERDVPLILLPHNVKKAHIIHPSPLKTPKCFDKYTWLTKTIPTNHLPTNYVTTEPIADAVLTATSEIVAQTVAYQKRYKNNDNPWFIQDRLRYSLVQNLLRICYLTGDTGVAGMLSPINSFLYHKPKLETYWPRNYQFYKTDFNPDYVIRTREGFDVIEEPKAVTPEELDQLPGPYTPYSMNVYRHGIVHLRSQPAMDNSKQNPIKHCHTTVLINNRLREREQFLASGLFTCFAQAHAQALDRGEFHGTELRTPITTQTIVTNGHEMAFFVYQLNTLHLLDDKGCWNRVWIREPSELYKRQEEGRHHVFEDAELKNPVDGFNDDALQLFVKFLHKPVCI